MWIIDIQVNQKSTKPTDVSLFYKLQFRDWTLGGKGCLQVPYLAVISCNM